MSSHVSRISVLLVVGPLLPPPRRSGPPRRDEAACDLHYNAGGGHVRQLAKGSTAAGQFLPGAGVVVREFSYEGWVVTIGFRDQRAARLRFEREHPTERYLPQQTSEIAEAETAAILKANTVGGAWREVPASELEQPKGSLQTLKDKTRPCRVWVRADGAVAYLYRSWMRRDSLYLQDRRYVQENYPPPKPPPPPASKPIPRF